ncbi:uncharacterized protein LOC107788796 isoform X1 [Nicotiana tabacum]|uniref:Uncharacterized protein LOC107788796 isoform X1 n=2 Tax=Nicotiana TaxID=4085 RepID=A0A1S3ZNX9_TOBAC|nr:PREDICTED: uncharacterized protein LOC104229119 isoform X1 [Nicotiana sylvestris]XP_016465994.1 PREDICTED: uncharacterized protein LOC107788796 isoform X1 [Nicotiana tabacum]
MEDSSENLDDGMLWLPSDIFPVEEVSVTFPSPKFKFKNNHPNTCTCCCYYSCIHHNDHLSLMDEQQETDNDNIIQRFAAFSLLHQRNHQPHSVPKSFPISERFRPAERYSCTDCSLSGCVERNRGEELLQIGVPPPVYPYQFYTPVQPQVERLIEARSRVLQMQENRFMRMRNLRINENRFMGSRFLPFVGSGYGNGGGGSSTCGGTGVFLPRVPTNINDYRNHPHARKRQGGGRNRQEVQQTGQSYPCI